MQQVRSEKAKKLVSNEEVRVMTSLINRVVDLDFFDEIEEQEIFEYSVCRIIDEIAGVLPPTYVELVRSAHIQGIDDQLASALTHRMEAHVQTLVQLVFWYIVRLSLISSIRPAVPQQDGRAANHLVRVYFAHGSNEG